MKRILCLLLSALFILTIFCSCNSKPKEVVIPKDAENIVFIAVSETTEWGNNFGIAIDIKGKTYSFTVTDEDNLSEESLYNTVLKKKEEEGTAVGQIVFDPIRKAYSAMINISDNAEIKMVDSIKLDSVNTLYFYNDLKGKLVKIAGSGTGRFYLDDEYAIQGISIFKQIDPTNGFLGADFYCPD